MTNITLPPLPVPYVSAMSCRLSMGPNLRPLFDDIQMRAYATAAALAERERCASLIERATSRQRALRAAVNGALSAGVEPCALAALIRKGGNP